MLIGIISDTHGLLRSEALQALRGSAMIIHAGDVGKPAVLEHLRGLAPVIAVRGNIDRQPWGPVLARERPAESQRPWHLRAPRTVTICRRDRTGRVGGGGVWAFTPALDR
jgi:putative phosphoesterase